MANLHHADCHVLLAHCHDKLEATQISLNVLKIDKHCANSRAGLLRFELLDMIANC